MKKRTLSMFIALMLVFSLFSSTALAANPLTNLEAPTNLTAELKFRDDGNPYFKLSLNIPLIVKEVNTKLMEDSMYYEGIACDGIEIAFEFKYGNYDWNEGPSLMWNTTDSLTEFIDRGNHWEYEPFDSGTFNSVDVQSEVYQFRARFSALWGEVDGEGEVGWVDNENFSQYSNIVIIGNPAFYEDASTWAEPELKKAQDAGLIPDILMGSDMTKPITREEFCELAVLLYEQTTEKPAVPSILNPFMDTENTQILKAYNLGITEGISKTTFEPKTLISREQCATMLYRAIKSIAPMGDYKVEGVADFPDQKYISSWAVEGTKYMSKLGIIVGDKDGNFMPNATASVKESATFGMATREAAILMTFRTYDELK
ncbi:MAG: hypothetical protein CVV02_05640 [Firmicutes bacterium HGW-Firmicutes-7]|nr:MAG: hypothetical protein CVV02_05640 [Firmicutes bacterium HGW-Firmicutes-7]